MLDVASALSIATIMLQTDSCMIAEHQSTVFHLLILCCELRSWPVDADCVGQGVP